MSSIFKAVAESDKQRLVLPAIHANQNITDCKFMVCQWLVDSLRQSGMGP